MSEAQPVVFLKGRNISLRPIQEEDLIACGRWINDPDIRDFLNAYWPMTQSDEKEWLAGIGKKKPNDLILAMVTNDGKHIGNMAIHRIDWRDRVGTTGAIIGEKEYWNKGYGTEAKILLLNHAFNSMNLRKICSLAIAYNGRSQRYSEKCGYKLEGVLKDQVFRKGQYWDVVNMAVFREDFEPVWKKYTEEESPRA